MAPEWEIGMGMDFGMGMGMGATFSAASAAAAPLTASASPAYLYGLPSTDTLHIDDLLDFSNHDLFPSAEAHLLPTHEQSSAITAATHPFFGDTSSSSIFQTHHDTSSSFPNDIYIPSEEAAELEWLSKFVEDSFSDIPYPTAVSGIAAPAGDAHLRAEPSVPGRGARSKRSRAPTGFAAAATWSSLPPPSQSSPSSSSSSSDFPPSKPKSSAGSNNNDSNGRGKKGVGEGRVEGGVRRCTHCASEKTPQWRTGPLGPKTLCNACGVRYKSGRLVPEYRPAASPTFVLTQHSNSHRKVMELRRQKELLLLHHDNSSSIAAASTTAAQGQRPELLFPDYGVC
ncbi:GATA transcription factor 2 [Phoenix dactylifera]|uniref:GATA transcription factor 2 n=1 Tax=Phoenix dactylifera TaxID=42345 RepID=A0A8B7CNJ0_PHODC|nr:GATA transcription factor 2 [Phoenix dactylifera]